MAIVTFTSAQPGQQGERGPSADRDINSMIMLSWLGQPIVKGYDLYTNNFSTIQGVDSTSTAVYNAAGYYEPPQARTDCQVTYPTNSTDEFIRSDYKGDIYRWYQDSGDKGHFEGPINIVTSGGAAVDKGSGKVGIPCLDHTLNTNDIIEIRGTTNYNGSWVVDSTSSANEVVITSAYTAETFGNVTINKRTRLGVGGDNANVQSAMAVEFYDGDPLVILGVTVSGYQFNGVQLNESKPTSVIKGIYNIFSDGEALYPPSAYSTTNSGWTTLFNEAPGSRYNAGMAYDPVRKELWMFGGYRHVSSSRCAETWKYSTVSGQWTYVSTPSAPSARECNPMVYDPVNQVFYLFGGWTGSAYLNDLYKLNPASGTWTVMSPTGGPPGVRAYCTPVYAAISGTMLVYGGYNGSTRLNDMWEYTIATNVWRSVTFSNPGGITGRSEYHACFQTASGSYIIHGGIISAETAETWKFNYINNTFYKLTSSPYTFRAGGCFYDETEDKMYIVNGYRSSVGTTDPGVWQYDFKNTWQQITPSPNEYGRAVYLFSHAWDQSARRFYYFSGNGSYYYNNQIWCYDVGQNTFKTLYPQGIRRATMAFDYKRNKIYICFGSNGWDHNMWELWEIDCITDRWTRIGCAHTSYIDWTMMVYSPNYDCLFFFSGRNIANLLYKYNLNSTSNYMGSNWEQQFPAGVWPVTRQEAQHAYDTDNDVYYILGGASSINDFSKYDVKSNSYTKLQIPGTVIGLRWESNMLYDPINKCLWVVFGYIGSYRNDIWKFDIEHQLWSAISYNGVIPSIRSCGHQAALDPVTQSILIFSGEGGAGSINDFYRYDIRLNTMYRIANTTPWPTPRYYGCTTFNFLTGDFYLYGGTTAAVTTTSEMNKYNLWDSVTTSGIVTTVTSGNSLCTAAWDNVSSITPNYSSSLSSTIYHALSFDQANSFKIYTDSWIPIVQLSADTWQYLDGTGSWQNAAENNVNKALSQALTVSGNRMDGDSLAALTYSDFATASGYVAGAPIDFGIGFDSQLNMIPKLYGYDITYGMVESDLILITEAWSASQNDPVSCKCLIDITTSTVVTLDGDLKAWVSIDNGNNYEQITGLAVLRQVDQNYIITGDKTGIIARGDNQVRLKITTHNSKVIYVNAVGMSVGY